ncbi:MAG: hypothetical protein H6828_07525 [Planctomycetes bacterium]|nr:hypothetical protein [Planctomycetota bacterium]
MLLSTLLTLALVPALPQGRPGTTAQRPPAPQAPAPPARGIHGELLTAPPGSGGSVAATLGGSYTRVTGPVASVTAVPAYQVYQLSFNNPGTGWQESCLVGVPGTPVAPAAPLLVMFHGYGVSELDCYLNTPIFKLALERGWYVVAPLGAHQYNFGIPYSQANVEYVLDWAMATFPVDAARVYGVGFSMGGGGVTSYMARHQDPAHARFAAVVNHTGGVSIGNTYWNSVPNTWVFDDVNMFGGSPALHPFEYAQCSLIDLDASGTVIDPSTDMARNAAHVPLLDFTVSQEPLAYLRAQVLALHGWMQAFTGLEQHVEVPGATHSWAWLDAHVALDFLRQHTLTPPRAGTHRVLADREAVWHHFFVYQDAPGAFTPFRWTMLDGLNRLVIDQTQNLKRIVVDHASLQLHTSVPAEVMFGTQDGLPEELTLSGYPIAPSSVTRGGLPTGAWSWDPVAQSVTLFESNATNYPLWRITP